MWQGSILLIINNWGCLTTETCTKIKLPLLRTALSLDYKGWNICKTDKYFCSGWFPCFVCFPAFRGHVTLF